MSKEPELFDYVAALRNQPKITAPRPMFGPSPRHRQRMVTSSAQAPSKQLASIYDKRDSVTESLKCPVFGPSKSTCSSASSYNSNKSIVNKSRYSNFAKTPSPPRETPKFIKARTTLESTKTSEIQLNSNPNAAELPSTAMKQSNTSRLFQTPSQTINSTAFMSEERKAPESYDTSTKIQKLKQTGLYDRIRSLTCKLQIEEDEEESNESQSNDTDQSTETRISSETDPIGAHATTGIGHDRAIDRNSGSSEEEESNVENNSNVPNRFMINDSIMIIKETFSAKKKMMQLGMLPVPRYQSNLTYQNTPGMSPEPPHLRQQSLLKYFNKADSNEHLISGGDENLRHGRDGMQEPTGRSSSQETVRRVTDQNGKSPYRSKSETSVYEVSIPVNALQTSVARMADISTANPSPVVNRCLNKPQDLDQRLSAQKKVMSASVSNLPNHNALLPPPSNDPINPKSIKSSSCSSVNSDNGQPNSARKPVARSDANESMNKSELKKLRIRGKVYYLLSLLGQGGSAKVYQVYDPSTQKNLAVKVVDLMKADSSTRAGYENEIVLLQKLSKCKRVVQLIDYERIRSSDGTLKRLFLVMEKGDADLSNVLKQFIEPVDKYSSNRYILDPHLVKHHWKEMLKAVDEIHSMDVVHSDLKPVNFITVSGKLKLIDFGIANVIESDCTSVIKDNQIGTINYMAPESLQSRTDIDPRQYGRHCGNNSGCKGNTYGSGNKNSGQKDSASKKSFIKYNCKADIWSLGCILYNLVYGKPPFGHLPNLVAKIQAICNPNFTIAFQPIDDPDLIDCLKKCLERDPKKRPTTKQLLEHPYLTRINSCSSIDTLRTNKASTNDQPHKSPFKTPEPPGSSMASQINALTPTRYNELSKFLQNLTRK